MTQSLLWQSTFVFTSINCIWISDPRWAKRKAGLERLHYTQSYRSAAGFSNPCLTLCSIVPATGFDPETRDPEFRWLSRHRCAGADVQSPKPREWNSDPGTQSGFTPIGGGRYQSGNARRGLEDVLLQGPLLHSALGAEPRRSQNFYWRRRRRGAGLREDGERAAGGGMKRLRKQTGKCRRAAALGNATVQVGRSLRSGAAVSGLREDWRVGRWPCGAKVKVLAAGEAGMLRLQFCWEVTLRPAWGRQAGDPRVPGNPEAEGLGKSRWWPGA